MTTLTVTFKPDRKSARVDVNVDQFERLAGALGLFNREFLTSIEHSEREIKAGKTRVLQSLKSLRRA